MDPFSPSNNLPTTRTFLRPSNSALPQLNRVYLHQIAPLLHLTQYTLKTAPLNKDILPLLSQILPSLMGASLLLFIPYLKLQSLET